MQLKLNISHLQESLCASFCRELKFAICCGGSTKPIKSSDGGGEASTPHQENGLPFMPMPGFSSSSPSKGFASLTGGPLVQPLVKDPEGSTYYRYGRGTGSDV
ncbi:glutamate receptor ionotropic, kainate 2 [Caerostris extrusa]|uniref:Glutamate receptor ionotropic, kainate 2 n=1 Tax=Caerostris extrusa TaxID=172846 RepID=A0AAV4TNY9_CAEEX|nr:glutamate receptor ionotropic, kainate 2 [Caerostris extrusa]